MQKNKNLQVACLRQQIVPGGIEFFIAVSPAQLACPHCHSTPLSNRFFWSVFCIWPSLEWRQCGVWEAFFLVLLPQGGYLCRKSYSLDLRGAYYSREFSKEKIHLPKIEIARKQ